MILALLALAASPVLAQDKPTAPAAAHPVPAGKVEVQLMVVYAKDADPHIDPQLASLQKHLEFLRYDNFTVLSTSQATVGLDKTATFQVEGGRRVEIALISRDEKAARLRVQMYKGEAKLLDTTVTVNRGSTFIVAGPKHEEGMLLLPITAAY